jgi:hypothetical protein
MFRPLRLDGFAVSLLLIGSAIAALAPFDRIFASLTQGSILARVGLLLALALCGMQFARLSTLSLHQAGRVPILAGIAAAFGVAVYVCIIDAWVFRQVLPGPYVNYLETHALGSRLTYYMMRAFNENIFYRLFAVSTLAYFLFKLTKHRTVAIVSAVVLAQVINVEVNRESALAAGQAGAPALLMLYYLMRGVVPGVLWGLLFWRFGFLSAEVASVGCHLFLQPMLGFFF